MERWGRLMWRLGVSVWFGSIFFLFAVIAPNVFRVLPQTQAGHLVDAIFPLYDAEGIVFGALILLGALLLLGGRSNPGRWVLVGVAIANWLLAFGSWITLRQMRELADQTAKFRHLHAQSVVLSVIMFLVVLFGLAWEAWGS